MRRQTLIDKCHKNGTKIEVFTLKIALSLISLSGKLFLDNSRVVCISSFQSLV